MKKLIYLILIVLAVTAVIFAAAMYLFSSCPNSIFWVLLILCFFSATSTVFILMIAWINRGDIAKWVKGKIKK